MFADNDYDEILIGDEVICRGDIPNTVGIVTHNTKDHFCVMLCNGISYHSTREFARPEKTGVHYDELGKLLTDMRLRGMTVGCVR